MKVTQKAQRTPKILKRKLSMISLPLKLKLNKEVLVLAFLQKLSALGTKRKNSRHHFTPRAI
jgi:hypothetical protein